MPASCGPKHFYPLRPDFHRTATLLHQLLGAGHGLFKPRWIGSKQPSRFTNAPQHLDGLGPIPALKRIAGVPKQPVIPRPPTGPPFLQPPSCGLNIHDPASMLRLVLTPAVLEIPWKPAKLHYDSYAFPHILVFIGWAP
jgi:hypothetical protein